MIVDLVREVVDYRSEVIIPNPIADEVGALHEYGFRLTAFEDLPVADALVVAVIRNQNGEKRIDKILSKLKNPSVLVDVKFVYAQHSTRSWVLDAELQSALGQYI
jgi:UDP-N-acetyl-D-galactosamine dehydrogenase